MTKKKGEPVPVFDSKDHMGGGQKSGQVVPRDLGTFSDPGYNRDASKAIDKQLKAIPPGKLQLPSNVKGRRD